MSNDARDLAILYPAERPRVDGGLRVRLALVGLAREVCPEADDALVVVNGELDWSGVRHRGPMPWVRWPGFPRAYECRLRLGALVAGVYPDALKAYAVFFLRDRIIGVLELPLPARASA